MNHLVREMAETVPEGEDKSLLESAVEAVAKLEEEGEADPAKRLAAFFGNIGMIRVAVRDKSGKMRYPRHEHIGGLMTSRLLKQMGMDKELAEEVKAIIQGRGEVRLKKERKHKLEQHRKLLRRQQQEKARRRRERAERHNAANCSARSQSAGVSRSTDLSDGMT